MCLTVDALSVGASKFASGVLGARTSPTLLLAGMLYYPLFACLRHGPSVTSGIHPALWSLSRSHDL